jgi:hypothetical protein
MRGRVGILGPHAMRVQDRSLGRGWAEGRPIRPHCVVDMWDKAAHTRQRTRHWVLGSEVLQLAAIGKIEQCFTLIALERTRMADPTVYTSSAWALSICVRAFEGFAAKRISMMVCIARAGTTRAIDVRHWGQSLPPCCDQR